MSWSDYYTRLELIIFAVSFVSFHSFQMYRSWRGWKFYREFLIICQAWGAVIGILLFYFFIFKLSEGYSRVVFFMMSLTMPFIIFSSHFLVRKLLRFYRSRGKNIRRAVIVGSGELGQQMAMEVENIPWAGIEIIGFFDDKIELEGEGTNLNRPLLGRIDEVEGYLRTHDIDYVYIALPMRAEKKIFRILRDCRDLGAHVFLVPDLYIYGLHHAEIQSLGEMLVLSFNPDRQWKRVFDVLFSLLILIGGSPIFMLLALLIKLDSPGPVFYRHRRITSAGREFFCLKFRSMIRDADRQLERLLQEDSALQEEWRAHYKLRNDPRVTRFGRFLRRTSLDELPQFINVLRGEMSVVGARPIIGKELEEYYKGNGEESAGLYCSMKPGVTGLWQVMLRSDMDDYRQRVELDDWYVLNYSLRTDLRIIWQTIVCMINGKGAY